MGIRWYITGIFYTLLIPLFWAVFARIRSGLAREIRPYPVTGFALSWSRRLCPLILLIVYIGAEIHRLERAADRAFAGMEANIEGYLDWYYSLVAEYARIASLLAGVIEDYMAGSGSDWP